jgi:hypothetical protein
MGLIGQSEAAKLMMMGSDGKLEVANPVSDDDRRDQEIHGRGEFGRSLALQIKISMGLGRRGKHVTPLLEVTFPVNSARLVSHPLFWYLFAYLDPKTMAFGDPVFLVNSAAIHAGLRKRRGKTWLEFNASMGPSSHDQWVANRVHPADLGKRVLQILKASGRLAGSGRVGLPSGPDLIWVGMTRAKS